MYREIFKGLAPVRLPRDTFLYEASYANCEWNFANEMCLGNDAEQLEEIEHGVHTGFIYDQNEELEGLLSRLRVQELG